MTKGNMYAWLDKVYNPIRGCTNGCPYCYLKSLKRIKIDKPTLCAERMFPKYFGYGQHIGLCLTGDLFCSGIPDEWIKAIISVMNTTEKINALYSRPSNTYYIQTKSIDRLAYLISVESIDRTMLDGRFVVIGTTIETNRNVEYEGGCLQPQKRLPAMKYISKYYRTFITLEPLMAFDMDPLLDMVKIMNPRFVNIGLDSKGNNLPEPTKEDIYNLIWYLAKMEIPVIRLKANLGRILTNIFNDREITLVPNLSMVYSKCSDILLGRTVNISCKTYDMFWEKVAKITKRESL